MASAISSIVGSAPTAGATSSAAAASSSSAPTEQMFLQLLVAQIQNQDPLNPADSMQFVTQLAQFSELEQVMGIRQDIETDFSPASGATAATSASTSAATSASTTASTPAATTAAATPATTASSNN
jgi:flagellar basal-body rod modification protein FlgD